MFNLTTDKQVLIIFDALSGKSVKIYCRVPTTDEKIEYKSKVVTLRQNDISDVLKYQLEAGEKLITGFEDGFFADNDKPISSDPNSKNYNSAWYAFLKSKRPEIIWNCVDFMYGASSMVLKGEQPPFGKTTGN